MATRYLLILAATCAACTVSAAADLPARKPGLWEITITSGNPKIPPMVEKVCLDAATDQLLYKFAAGVSAKLCSRVDLHTLPGGKVALDTQCKIGSTLASSHGMTTMSGDTAYHTETAIHYEPALLDKTDVTSTQDAKWTGACPAGMKPGDIELVPTPMMPVPMKMNLNEMFKGG